MSTIEIPAIEFPKWKRWADRERPSRDFDVPVAFGLLGIYMLATSDVDNESSPAADKYLNQAVIYIGMSDHVERRLERSHDAVQAYKKQTGDPAASDLLFTIWHSGASKGPFERKGPVVAAASRKSKRRTDVQWMAQKMEEGVLTWTENDPSIEEGRG